MVCGLYDVCHEQMQLLSVCHRQLFDALHAQHRLPCHVIPCPYFFILIFLLNTCTYRCDAMGYIVAICSAISQVLTNCTSPCPPFPPFLARLMSFVIPHSAGLFGLRVYALYNRHRGILAILVFLIITQASLNIVRIKFCVQLSGATLILLSMKLVNLGLSFHTSTDDILVTALLSGTSSCVLLSRITQVVG